MTESIIAMPDIQINIASESREANQARATPIVSIGSKVYGLLVVDLGSKKENIFDAVKLSLKGTTVRCL